MIAKKPAPPNASNEFVSEFARGKSAALKVSGAIGSVVMVIPFSKNSLFGWLANC